MSVRKVLHVVVDGAAVKAVNDDDTPMELMDVLVEVNTLAHASKAEFFRIFTRAGRELFAGPVLPMRLRNAEFNDEQLPLEDCPMRIRGVWAKKLTQGCPHV